MASALGSDMEIDKNKFYNGVFALHFSHLKT